MKTQCKYTAIHETSKTSTNFFIKINTIFSNLNRFSDYLYATQSLLPPTRHFSHQASANNQATRTAHPGKGTDTTTAPQSHDMNRHRILINAK